jgi:long-subunit fatty acid transport protein
LTGTVNFNIDIFSRTVNRRDLTFNLEPSAAPSAGIIVSPNRDLRFALSYRGPLDLKVRQPNNINIGVAEFDLVVQGSVLYTPHQIAMGVQYRPTLRWVLSADLKLDLWSKAPAPGAQLNVKVKGEAVEGLAGDAFDFGSKDGATGFQNTWTPSLSGEYDFPSQGAKVRAGYAFRPPYVPNQNGSTNWLDTSTHLFGAGASIQFHDPLEVFSQPLYADLAAQLQVAQTREVVKNSSADPVGNYKFGGVAMAATAGLRYEF